MKRSLFKDIKTDFAISSLGILNPQTDNKLAKRVIEKSLKIMCQNDISAVFIKAAKANNLGAVKTILDFHTNSVGANGNFLEAEKRDLPRVLTVFDCSEALQSSIENDNLEMAKTLINRFDEWNFCHPNPVELEHKTEQEYLSETLGLPITYGVQNLQRDQPERVQQPQKMEQYLKTVLDQFLPQHALSHIATPNGDKPARNVVKPQLRVIQGGKSTLAS